MGIPRLSSDLSSYAETIHLGNHQGSTSAKLKVPDSTDVLTTSKLVIDGPSLIYHVCHCLYTSRQVPLSRSVLLEYAEINAAVRKVLQDFESAGIEIAKIVFDGALPMPKRPIRLQRLENTRRELEAYRNAHTHLPFDVSGLAGRRSTSKTGSLPQPPFMVASAIEDLRTTEWSCAVETVPGEADAWCASYARSLNAAILTNDSDLTMYDADLIVLLHSALVNGMCRADCGCFVAQCLQPNKVAERMSLSSLRIYGFERMKDPSATSATIKERAKTADISCEEYKTFHSHFDVSLLSPKAVSYVSIAGADPRIAEVLCQLYDPEVEQVHVYLPVLLEDVSRDAAWSYGSAYRQIAYSLAASSAGRVKDIEFVEYARKGARVVATSISLLKIADIDKQSTNFLNIAQQYLGADERNEHATSVLSYWMLALHILYNTKRSKGASAPLSFAYKAFGSVLSYHDLTWDDMHTHATAQATLYSFRILKQLSSHVPYVNPSGEALGRLPSLAELHLSPSRLQRNVRDMNHAIVQKQITMLNSHFEIVQAKQRPEESQMQQAVPRIGKEPDDTSLATQTRSTVKTKRQHRTADNNSEHAVQKGFACSNNFTLLQDDG